VHVCSLYIKEGEFKCKIEKISSFLLSRALFTINQGGRECRSSPLRVRRSRMKGGDQGNGGLFKKGGKK